MIPTGDMALTLDAAAQLVYARKLEDAGRKRKARKQYNALVRKWHESPEAVHAQYSYAKLLEEKGKLPCTIKFVIEGEEEAGSPNLKKALDEKRKFFENW